MAFKSNIYMWKWMFVSARSVNSSMADYLFTLSMNVCMQSFAGAANAQAFFPRSSAIPSSDYFFLNQLCYATIILFACCRSFHFYDQVVHLGQDLHIAYITKSTKT